MVAFTAEQRIRRLRRRLRQRETGTRAQRDVLTNHGTELHSAGPCSLKMAELGWTGIVVPEEYGSSGAGNVELCILLEECLRGGAPIGGIGPTHHRSRLPEVRRRGHETRRARRRRRR